MLIVLQLKPCIRRRTKKRRCATIAFITIFLSLHKRPLSALLYPKQDEKRVLIATQWKTNISSPLRKTSRKRRIASKIDPLDRPRVGILRDAHISNDRFTLCANPLFPLPPVNYSHFRDFFLNGKPTHRYAQHFWRKGIPRSRGRKDRRRKRYQPAFNEPTLGHCSTPWVEINAALADRIARYI